MNTNPKLESYLSRLDRALAPLPLSDRAEIVLEIKSHILSALERDSGQSVEGLIAALGEPEVVANRYLMERGKAPVKPPISPVVKWLVMGVLGTIALILLFVGTLLWKFSPLLQVDEQGGRVRILGGLIDIDEKSGQTKISRDAHRFDGTHALPAKGGKIELRFINGEMEFASAAGATLTWNCRSRAKMDEKPQVVDGALILDFSKLKDVHCNFSVPQDAEVQVKGVNGDVQVHEPKFHLELRLVNGDFQIAPANDAQYRMDFGVMNGVVDSFESPNFHSSEAKAFRLTAHLTNGRIKREE